jgi:hypothetical protein
MHPTSVSLILFLLSASRTARHQKRFTGADQFLRKHSTYAINYQDIVK